MCYIKVADVEAVQQRFADSLKQHTGRIPRAGLPRITKVRELSLDRRFTLVDPGGNTFYIGTPVNAGDSPFFRTLQSAEFAQPFGVLYDLLYSKEDAPLAARMLPKLLKSKAELDELDRARLLLVALDIQRQTGQPLEDRELVDLLASHPQGDETWQRVRERHFAILGEG